MTELNTFIIEPKQPAKSSIIWMHGLGANAHDFEDLVPILQAGMTQPTRFVFPNAPIRPVTINNGMAMPAWYDIYHLDRIDQQDQAGIEASAKAISQLIDQEIALGIASEHIFLAGFSQGGAMALHTGLRYPSKLAGIIALSTYLPLSQQLAEQASHSNQNTPIFMAHGTHDPVLPMILAEMSKMQLDKLHYAVTWHDYAMAHEICQPEIADLLNWLNQVQG